MGQYMGHGASWVVQGNIRSPTFIDIGVWAMKKKENGSWNVPHGFGYYTNKLWKGL